MLLSVFYGRNYSSINELWAINLSHTMNIPNLPTDNLYKFIALTGVVLFIISLLLPEYLIRQYRDDIELYNGDVRKLGVEKAESEEKRQELKKQIDFLDKKSNSNCNSIVNDTLVVRSRVYDGPKELVQLSKQIDERIEEYFELNRVLKIKSIEIMTKLAIIENKEKDINEIKEASEFFIPFAISLAILGFFLWFEKTQKHQDKVIQKQATAYTRFKRCQSCGIKLSHQEEVGKEDLSVKKYCNTCYSNGSFREPDLTLKEMEAKVLSRCNELGFNRIETFIMKSRIKNLERWNNDFHW